jgi:hypothetical protein|tara:strand:- start:2098 stop:2328 length:231 start_codon:yes stop_codon:yes gene_type:complete
MIGYSQLIAFKNGEADKNKIGVKLGRICIDKNVPVQIVANYFGVSRVAIYAWFCGEAEPRKKKLSEINDFIKNLRD